MSLQSVNISRLAGSPKYKPFSQEASPPVGGSDHQADLGSTIGHFTPGLIALNLTCLSSNGCIPKCQTLDLFLIFYQCLGIPRQYSSTESSSLLDWFSGYESSAPDSPDSP